MHKPLLTSAAVIGRIDGTGDPLALVTIDNCVFAPQDESALRARIRERAGLPEANLLLTPSHSHSSANINTANPHLPGGDQAQPYLDFLARAIGDAIEEARNRSTPAWITWGTGKCTLARNRDFWDEEAGQFACGFNPAGPQDDTLLIGRVTDNDGAIQAVLFNYACHPTTLAWDNNLFSPDYIGAAREVVTAIYGAPALFMQGASGELGPRESYVGDTDIADRNGRQLGYAVASTMESLPPAGDDLRLRGRAQVRSRSGHLVGPTTPRGRHRGRIGARRRQNRRADRPDRYANRRRAAGIARRPAKTGSCRSACAVSSASAARSAMERASTFQSGCGVWATRSSSRCQARPYSILQMSLRETFPDTPILVLGVTNGGVGYLPPRDRYSEETLYQVWQSPYAAGCLEAVMAAAEKQIRAMV